MLKYVDRRNSNSNKWDSLEGTFGADGLLPFWIADMDFRIDEHIIRAMHDYVEFGVPGYYKVPDSYYQAFIDWEKSEHGFEVNREWLRFSPGIVVGFHIAVQVLTEPGDGVLITTPVYYPFSNSIRNNDRKIVASELVNKDGYYHIDFDGDYAAGGSLDELKCIYKLKQCDLVSSTNVIFHKQSVNITSEDMSSGEFAMLSTVLSISAAANDPHTLVLLDEPELSLHPNWQMTLIDNLDRALKNQVCHLLIATHSHMLVSDLPLKRSIVTQVEKDKNGNLNSTTISESTY